MIIVLKNADFSQSNIGTLSTWRIYRSLGTGATYEGPISVDKGATLNATVTISEGYELGTAGISMTMGGVANNSYTINGNIITIAIAEVTGNVVIKVPTINVNTGEEDEPTVPDTPTQPDDTTYTFEDVTSQVNFNGGYYINGTTGSVITNGNWKHSPYGNTTSIDLTPYAGGKMRITIPVSPTMPNGLGIGFYSQFSKEATFINGYTSEKTVSDDTYETVVLDIPENAQCFRTTWYANKFADEFKCELAKPITSSEPSVPDPEPEPEEPDTPSIPSEGNITDLFTWTSNSSINSATGAQDQASDWRCSDYVNIAGYKSIDMMMIRTTSGSTTKGMAFYDANKTYISGVANNLNAQEGMTPELRTIEVPANAVYLRTSWCDDDNSRFVEGLSNLSFFYCIATA